MGWIGWGEPFVPRAAVALGEVGELRMDANPREWSVGILPPYMLGLNRKSKSPP